MAGDESTALFHVLILAINEEFYRTWFQRGSLPSVQAKRSTEAALGAQGIIKRLLQRFRVRGPLPLLGHLSHRFHLFRYHRILGRLTGGHGWLVTGSGSRILGNSLLTLLRSW